MARLLVQVSPQPLNPDTSLTGDHGRSGAVATFSGQVREDPNVQALELEHYPGVTEAALREIAERAIARWALDEAVILHRVGRMEIGDVIVFVGAAAPHRRAALEAVSFMIDTLKTDAPFWKKEHLAEGHRWVEPRQDDYAAAADWRDA